MDKIGMKRKRWNLIGFFAEIVVTLAMLCLIKYGYGHEHRDVLESILSILTVVLIVAIFAIIWRNVKQMCKSKRN